MNYHYVEFAARQKSDEMIREARREALIKAGRPGTSASSRSRDRLITWFEARLRTPLRALRAVR